MSAYEVVTRAITFTGNQTYDKYTLTAPAGKKPTSAGIQTTYGLPPDPNYGPAILYESYPDANGTDWHFTVLAGSVHNTATLYLVCVPAYTITAD